MRGVRAFCADAATVAADGGRTRSPNSARSRRAAAVRASRAAGFRAIDATAARASDPTKHGRDTSPRPRFLESEILNLNTNLLVAAFAALLGGNLVAQQITVTASGWTVWPASNLQTPVFSAGGLTPTDYIFGGLVAWIGTSTTGSYVNANASWAGNSVSGPQFGIVVPPTTVSGTESYTRSGTGGVVANLTAECNVAAFCNRTGTGYRAVANASVSVGCPTFGPLQAICQVRGVPPPAFPLLMTVPQSGSANLPTGQNSWYVVMYASADCSGTMSGTSALDMNALAHAYGTITLN